MHPGVKKQNTFLTVLVILFASSMKEKMAYGSYDEGNITGLS